MRSAFLYIALGLACTTCLAQDICTIPRRGPSAQAVLAFEEIQDAIGMAHGTILLFASSHQLVKDRSGAVSIGCPAGVGQDRLIVYDPELIKGDGLYFALAHETAHHVNNDPLSGEPPSKQLELEADGLAARYLTRPPLNWTSQKLVQALNALPLPQDAKGIYPSLEERRARVNEGYAAESARLPPNLVKPSDQRTERAPSSSAAALNSSTWTFVVSGVSWNCGDLIMPAIARGAKFAGARFYWHLGDVRALHQVDVDYAGLHRSEPALLTMDAYRKAAWSDFEKQQVAPFGQIPFFLGIGNHETIGRTQDQFVGQFGNLLNVEPIRRQRETDDVNDHTVRTYYHWRAPGADVINLDNADSIFDANQLQWTMKVLDADEKDPEVKVVLVGMHEALPYSYAFDHSMNQGADRGDSGGALYSRLIEFRMKTGKPVYVFSAHAQYYLANIYNTGRWKNNGGVLPGWEVGTAGGEHYSVPPEVKGLTSWEEKEYGYAMVRVTPGAVRPVDVQFVAVKREDLDAQVESVFGTDAVDFCFMDNWRATLPIAPAFGALALDRWGRTSDTFSRSARCPAAMHVTRPAPDLR
jgi:hypothetical protein